MAWTTPRTFVAGELVTSTLLNIHVRDNLAYLKDRHRHLVMQRAATNQTLANQVWQPVTMDAEIIDQWGGFNPPNIFAALPPGGNRAWLFAEVAFVGQSGVIHAGIRITRATAAGVAAQHLAWLGPCTVQPSLQQVKLSLAAFAYYNPGELAHLELYVDASASAGQINFASLSILDYAA